MKHRSAASILSLAALGMPLKAAATGGLDCAISDGNLDFSYQALFSYSASSPLFQSKGEFVSKHPKTFAELRTLDTEKLRLIQQWYEGKDLKLQFYAETQGGKVPFAAIKLSIETTADEDELSYNGEYRLEITPAVADNADNVTIKLSGKVACSAG
jgi:hypothetical protein